MMKTKMFYQTKAKLSHQSWLILSFELDFDFVEIDNGIKSRKFALITHLPSSLCWVLLILVYKHWNIHELTTHPVAPWNVLCFGAFVFPASFTLSPLFFWPLPLRLNLKIHKETLIPRISALLFYSSKLGG